MKNFIEKYDNALSNDICDKLVELTSHKSVKSWQGVTGAGIQPEVKKTTDFNLHAVVSDDIKIAIRDALVKHLTLYMKENMIAHIPEALAVSDVELIQSWVLGTFIIDQRSLFVKKYSDETDHFNWHVDNQANTNAWLHQARQLVMMFYLNDVEKGGTTDFMHQNVSLKPTKGSLVIFPANWMHVHRGSPPLSGEKFILNYWLLQKNPITIKVFREIKDFLNLTEILKNTEEWTKKNM